MAILYSGTEGTCQWTIDDQGHLYIGDGVIDHATSSSNDWSWFRYSYKIKTASSGNISWALGANAFGMFYDCQFLTSFDVSNFNTSNVTSMFSMFNNCRLLTSLDLSNFDTSNVTDMRYMFNNCFSLISLNLSNFDTSKATNMSGMFCGCSSLTSLDLSKFDTSKVTDMSGMFESCSLLTAIVVSNKWTVAFVTSSSYMFSNCSHLMGEQGTIYSSSHRDASYAHIDGGSSNPGYLIDINSCSCYASFNSDNKELRIFMDTAGKYTDGQVIGSTTYWADIDNITGQNAPPWHNFPDDIELVRIINIYKPKTAYNLFAGCLNLASLDLSNLDTSNITDMHGMFYNCRILTSLDVSNFNTSNVTDMQYMFRGCYLLTSLDVSNFNTSNVTDMKNMFADCQALTSLDVSNFNTDEVTSMQGMFENCYLLTSLDVSNFNTSNVVNMNGMFNACQALTSLDLSSFDTSKVTNMGGMFYSCQSLTSLNLLSFDTSNVTNMGSMFVDCELLTSLDLSSFNTSQVENMVRMFYACRSLTTITISSNFRTDQVTNMSDMFNNCRSLISLDLSSFNTSNVINMNSMFRYCQSLTSLDISNFNTNNVSDMNEMFSNCINLTSLILPEDFASNTRFFSSVFILDAKLTQLNITKIYLKKVEKISNTFQGCPFSLNLVIGNIGLTSYTSAFKDSTGTFYIIDSTKSNTSWQTVASEYNNVFYNVDGAFLPAYKLNATRGSIADDEWVSDEGGDSICFTYDDGDITSISNIPEGFSCTSDAIIVKENNEPISLTWDNKTSILELQEFSEAHQYVMELTYIFVNENDWVYFLSEDTEVNNEKTYYEKVEDEYIVVSDPTGNPTEENYYERELNEYTKTVSQLISIAEPYALLDFRAGGKGIAVGKLSERNGFDITFPVSIGEGLIPPGEWSYFLSKDIEVNNSKTYYTYDEQTGEYNEVSNPTTESPIEQGYYEREWSVDLKNYQLLIGKYNNIDNDAYLVIGNGNDNDNRSNAFVINGSGNLEIKDNFKMINNSGSYLQLGDQANNADLSLVSTNGVLLFNIESVGNSQYKIVTRTDNTQIVRTDVSQNSASGSAHHSIISNSSLLISSQVTKQFTNTTDGSTRSVSTVVSMKCIQGVAKTTTSSDQILSYNGDRRADCTAIITQPPSGYTLTKYIFTISFTYDTYGFIDTGATTIEGGLFVNSMAGAIQMYGGEIIQSVTNGVVTTTAPLGWLLCDGSAISRATYARLFEAIGTMYGAGDGSTTFNLPDLRGKFPLGVSSGHPLSYTQTGSSGGEETHKLTTAEIPGHTHGPGTLNITASGSHGHKLTYETDAASGTAKNRVVPGDDTGSKTGSNDATKTATHTHPSSNFAGATAQNTGGGGAHNNMPPYRTVNFIIATGKTS